MYEYEKTAVMFINEPKYANRKLEFMMIKTIDEGTVSFTNGTATGWEVKKLLDAGYKAGDIVGLETVNFSNCAGWYGEYDWVVRRTDAELEAEHQQWLADYEQRKIDILEKYREEYRKQEEALPGWLRARLDIFHEKGGLNFQTDGWGYELAICALAEAYFEQGNDDYAGKVKELDDSLGCSGNQHEVAKALARAHREGVSLAGTIGGLSPITRSAFYEK